MGPNRPNRPYRPKRLPGDAGGDEVVKERGRSEDSRRLYAARLLRRVRDADEAVIRMENNVLAV
jgi:hypothetical protein